MLFNSYLFVFMFLPITFIGYFTLNRFNKTYGKIWLLIASLWFYAFFNIKYLPIMLFSICFNFILNRFITEENSLKRKKFLLIFALIVNVSILFYFKYFGFFIDNINIIFNASFTVKYLVLPLAISFFTFQQLSYIIDSYKGLVPKYNFLDYSLFVTFFPQLIAGPIVTHDEIIPQFADVNKKKINFENLSKGLMAFSFGLAKKVLIADVFGNAVNWGFANYLDLDSTNALFTMIFFTFQIYFDFSGYCDMATGIGLMFNIDITQNFNSPYRALNINDFWKRWHMTLTRFFTTYVYYPLGGNKKGVSRAYVNVLIVFLVSGLWHGASWTFILWGALHGLFSIFTRIFNDSITKIHPVLNWFMTFVFINITWIYFRASSISEANTIVKSIFKLNYGQIATDIKSVFYLPEFSVIPLLFEHNIFSDPRLYMIMYTAFAFFAILYMKNTNERINSFKPTIYNSLITIVLLIWSILSFAGVSTFLYFNF